MGIDRRVFFNHVSRFTPKPMPTLEAVCRAAAQASLDMQACAILVITSSLDPVRLIAKYRCLIPIIVATNDPKVTPALSSPPQAHPFQGREPKTVGQQPVWWIRLGRPP